MLGIVIVIVLLITGILLLNNYKNSSKLKNNPYGTNDLKQETIDLIGNKLYSNIIVPENLKKKLDAKETVTVYYFSPICPYCIQVTPVLMPLADGLDVRIEQFNYYEFEKEAK